MTPDRRYVLAGIVAALGVLTSAILLDVLGTILFAISVAYVLIPVHRWLVRRGFTEWTAAVVATLVAFLGAVAVFAPLFVTLYLRREELIALVSELPSELSFTAFGTAYSVEASDIQAQAVGYLQEVAISFATALPVLAIKFALFVTLLFGLLLKGRAAAHAAVAPVPHAYRDVVYALATRARETLYAIYVLQVATGIATFLIAYPLFWALGYENAFAIALFAGILQFVPIIGPSLVIVAIALYHGVVGDFVSAALVGVLGLALVAWLPDVAVRPRLARRSAGLPGSLYFVGFTGGLFTLGAIGIIVGPLIVAVFVEAVEQLADEVNGDELAEFEPLADSILPNEGEADLAFDHDGDPSVPGTPETDGGPGTASPAAPDGPENAPSADPGGDRSARR